MPCLVAPVLSSAALARGFASVEGFAEAMAAAKLAGAVVDDLFSEVLAVGAVHVKELALSDWQALTSWPKLRPLEVRRLVAVISPKDGFRVS